MRSVCKRAEPQVMSMLVLFIEYAKPTEPVERSQTTSSPANELHIFDSTTSATSLIIQNNNMMITSNITQGTSTVTGVVYTAAATPSFTVGGPSSSGTITTTANSTDKFMIFTSTGVNHTFAVPAGGLNCDILMIGGGGSGYLGAGGAGACIVAINQTLPAGSCVVNVGAGANSVSSTGVGISFDSFIKVDNGDRYRAKGGGSAPYVFYANGNNGGCGSGATYSSSVSQTQIGGAAVSTNVVNGSTATIGPSITSTYAVMGNDGGNNSNVTVSDRAGSGGGIGAAGTTAGKGGDGAYQVTLTGAATPINFRNYFANGSTAFGVQDGSTGNYYIGGGGGGYNGATDAILGGGLGGGGGGKYSEGIMNGIANTGGGGSGDSSSLGGSGIIIIRYRSGTSTTTYTHTPTITTTLSTPTLGTPSIELVRGTQGDSNTDYKIGNYNGDFIIKSSVSSLDTDYLRISSTGAITNPTGTASWNTGSDRRIKENIERASYDKCYESICRLELNRFNYIKGFNTVNRDITQLGFIAQEVNDIFPKAITSQAYYSDVLSIPDLLSIDVSQINYSLYGAVKKLIEINNNKELRLKKLECLLNVESDSDSGSSNVVIDSDVLTSNVVVIEDTMTSNVVISEDVLSSNVVIEKVITSNVVVVEDTMTSNVVIEDTMTSNVVIDSDVLSSNVVIIEDTMTSNIVIEDTMTSNVVIIDDTMSSNVVIEDTITSNVVIIDDTMSSNVVIEDTITSNVVIIDDTMSSNVVIEDTITSNVVIIEDTMSSNVVIEDTITSNVVIIEDTMTSNLPIEDTNNI
jgi:hypothetical protein